MKILVALLIFVKLPFISAWAQEVDTVGRQYDSTLKRYYQLVNDYRQGKKDYSVMIYMVNKAKYLNDQTIARTVSNDYIDNYLFKLDTNSIYQKENLLFISQFLTSSNNMAFRLFYKYWKNVDSIIGTDKFSRNVITSIISQEDVDPFLNKSLADGLPPEWGEIGGRIDRKYNQDISEQVILDAKIRWYAFKKDWKPYCRYVIGRVNKFGPFGLVDQKEWCYNQCAWEVFLHSMNKTELEQALSWSDNVIRISPMPNYLDTYANLLYKLGSIKEAIIYEGKALSADPGAKDIQLTLTKMKNGEPTWPSL